MTINKTIKLFCCFAILTLSGCKKKYDPPLSVRNTNYLVVEGVINSGQGPTNIKLSRTSPADSNITRYERRAIVRVEDQHNNTYPLNEKDSGIYSASQLNLNGNEKYRLYIKTGNGNEYVSDYSPVLRTPSIDSIVWERNNGVQLLLNTHDPSNKITNYRWAFEETWEFYSAYRSTLEFIFNPITGGVAGLKGRSHESTEKLYRCWKTEVSTEISTGTSAGLTRDTIHLPFTKIPSASWKISVLYSVNVKQYAITDKEYEFWRRMKKNTEQIGTIFDEQPSQLITNIHNINNPSELIVGYIGVADEQQKRIFISNGEVPDWNYRQFCDPPEAVELDAPSLNAYKTEVPLYYSLNPAGMINGVFIGTRLCSDCTTRGTNVKPSFWP